MTSRRRAVTSWNRWNTPRRKRSLNGDWAETVVGVVLDRLAAETDEKKRFEVLKRFLLEDKAPSPTRRGGPLAMSVAAMTSAIPSDAGPFQAPYWSRRFSNTGAHVRRGGTPTGHYVGGAECLVIVPQKSMPPMYSYLGDTS